MPPEDWERHQWHPQLPPAQPNQATPLVARPRYASHCYYLAVATANVGSLYTGPTGYAGKLGYIRSQMRAHGLLAMGIQEARTEQNLTSSDDILRISSGSDGGQAGVELWVDLQQPYKHVNDDPCYLLRKNFVVVHADPRALLVRVLSDHDDFWFLVAHSPHTGRPEPERAAWWLHLQTLVRHKPTAAPLIVLIDANAKTGPSDGIHIFQHSDVENANTDMLMDFVTTTGLVLPATMDIHYGPHDTWTSPDGQSHSRIDYIMVSTWLQSACYASSVLQDFDLGNDSWDHKTVGLQLYWTDWLPRPDKTRASNRKLQVDRHVLSRTDFTSVPPLWQIPSWRCDIEQHVAHLKDEVYAYLEDHCRTDRPRGKKPFVDEEIWRLRAHKTRCQKKICSLRHYRRQQLAQVFFQAWKTVETTPRPESAEVIEEEPQFTADDVLRFPTIIHSIAAWQLHWAAQYYVAASRLKHRLRQAKGIHLDATMAALPSDAPAHQILTALKPFLGPSNPMKAKRPVYPKLSGDHGQVLHTPEEIETAWMKFFGAMEGGQIVSEQDLRSTWLGDLARLQPSDPAGAEQLMTQLPTLTDLEAAFRRVPGGKASGPDDFPSEACKKLAPFLARTYFSTMFKLLLSGHEALEWKGGYLVPVHKGKGPKDDLAAHRSLLISSGVGKVIHRCIRQHQNPYYVAFQQAGQIGGRPHVPVQLGMHMVRTYLRWQRTLGRSTAVLFVDLKEAFYRLVRPLALGDPCPSERLEQMIARLGMSPATIQALRAHMAQPSALDQAGVPAHHQRAIKAIHSATWFTMRHSDRKVHTTAGSRPGDSFADVLFGYLYAVVLQGIQERLQAEGLLDGVESGPPGLILGPAAAPAGEEWFMGPSWMDDTAVCISGSTALELEAKLGPTIHIVLEEIRNRGMTPNLTRGKTEVLLSLRGAHSRKLRAKYFGPSSPGTFPVIGEDQIDHIYVTGQYLHLGGLVSHDGHVKKEIKRRASIAHQAFNAHRRLLYQNTSVAWKKRRELFVTLVLSKFTYGSSSWHITDQHTKDYLHATTMKLYRRLLKIKPADHCSDLEVLGRVQLPSPSTLFRRERLRHLGQLYTCRGTTAWGLLRRDSDWCQVVRDDFDWVWRQLHNAVSLGDPRDHWLQWEEILQHSPRYWKRLVARAAEHEALQHANMYQVRLMHSRVLGELTAHGVVNASETAAPAPIDTPDVYACMCCRRRFKSQGGEGAHFFKVHGKIAPVRYLFNTTRCGGCQKEYYTFGKLRAHLRHSTACVDRLRQQPAPVEPAPGIGSQEDRALCHRHGGLLPPLPNFGPELPGGPHRLVLTDPVLADLHHGVTDALLAVDLSEVEEELRTIIGRHAVSWKQMQETLETVFNEISDEDWHTLDYSKAELAVIFGALRDPHTWAFLQTPSPRVVDEDPLQTIAIMNDSVAFPWTYTGAIPRGFGKHRFVLHAFAGRRRHGDLQHFMDAAYARCPDSYLTVLSVDIINHASYGDLTNTWTQMFWLDAMRQQWVVGVAAGPPCNTWSRAREHQLHDAQGHVCRGPRVLRTLDAIWGLESMGLKEATQVLFGNQLLGFAIAAMYFMVLYGGVGFLEHPADLNPEGASIWKLPLLQLLLRMPAATFHVVDQGKYGSESRKPTGLLTIRLPALPVALKTWQICTVVPDRPSTGIQTDGTFRTSVLKEYPPAFCAALAESFVSAADAFEVRTDAVSPPAQFFALCKELHITTCGESIGVDTAGHG
eukprot:Skav214801  [mRNA]  locus=scaffold740:118185:123383:+ [translate_table: standard]